jgi:hypothetical protein
VRTRWGEIVEASRPDREQELAAVEAQVRKAHGSLDRYFKAFEEGKLREEVCTRRIEELSGELTSLEARRGHIQPVFHVPVLGPPHGSVPPGVSGFTT